MEGYGLHPELELGLQALGERIATLQQKMSQAKGVEKVEDFGEIEELQRRYDTLAERLRALNREGPGFRQDHKAELEKLADDLSGTVEDFVTWIDSDHRSHPPPMWRRQP